MREFRTFGRVWKKHSCQTTGEHSLDALSAQNLGKMQVIGRLPRETGGTQFREAENCWNIDNGAVFG